jgi:hypothetical protein
VRPYGTVSPLFWTGSTGKRLRANRDAQVVALYLMTNPHSHQTGLYYLPKMYLAHEIGIPLEGACKALQSLSDEAFCLYDEASEWIWVREMAAWQIGTNLKQGDKRCEGVHKYLESVPDLPFLHEFKERYKNDFHLTNTPTPLEGASEGLSLNKTGTIQDIGASPDPSPKARKSRKTTFPDSFALSPDLAAYAAEHLPDADVPEMFEGFKRKALAKGWTYASWDRAWQEFVRNCRVGSGHFAAGQYPKKGAGGVRWQ